MKSLFNIVADLKARNFIKKRLQHRCFPVSIAIFLKTAFFYRTPQVAASLMETFTRNGLRFTGL